MSFDQGKRSSVKSRIEMADADRLNEAQLEVYNRIVSGKRGRVVGPLRVALHSPELADKWQALGEFLRYQTELSLQISELAIISIGRYWNSQVEWMIHARIAAESGLSEHIIESIRTASVPRFENKLDALVYDFTSEVLEFGQVDDDLYEQLHALIGTAPLVELTALIGYYSMVAMTLNVHHVPVPASEIARPLELPAGGELMRPTPLPKSVLIEAELG